MGDCYFIAAGAATAENSARFSNSFITKNYTTSGIIVISAYVLGLKTNIILDDYLPFASSNLKYA